jgi:agmatine/peptidylarginine deiminase
MRFYKIQFFIFFLLIISHIWCQPAQPVRMCAEWEPAWGVLIRWPLSIPMPLVVEFAEDDTIYVLVEDSIQHSSALSTFVSWNVNMTHCQFIYAPTNSCWTRDWGPQCIFDGDGNWGIVDPMFEGYPWVPGGLLDPTGRDHEDDDAVNAALAEYFECPLHQLPAFLTGGNIMTDGHGTAFSTQQMLNENSTLWSPEDFIYQVELYNGIENYNFVSNTEDYGIQHIDCAAKLLDEETILIKQLPLWHPEYDRIETVVGEVELLTNCYGRPYKIVRIFCDSYNGNSVAGYTNSLILNKKVFVPLFGIDADDDAIQTYQDAMPGYEVIGFYNNTSHPWYYYDALHCRTMGIFDRYMLRITHCRFDAGVPAFEEIEIIATIDDRSEAGLIEDSLKVYWRIEEQIPWNNMYLTEITSIDSFVAYIPGQPEGTIIEYYISASDYSGRTETLPRTAPNGFYYLTVEATSSEIVQTKPKNLLYQNYPNPFNPSTTISFSVPQTSPFVTLKIFNIKGQKVRTLFKGKAEEGKHTVTWNGTNDDNQQVSSGIYFYKLKTNNYTEVKKCILMK